MRIALAQINPTVGDLESNGALIARFAAQARRAGADLVVMPELCLTGYPPKDLLLQEGFLAAVTGQAKRVGESASAGITLVFGAPLPASEDGSGIANSLLAYRDGQLVDYYDKRLLPTYDVFDEDRYFVPGDRTVVIAVPCAAEGGAAARVGLSICEDLWKGEDVGFAHRYVDRPDPVEAMMTLPAGQRPAVIVNPSASPFVLGKGNRHREILRDHATRHGVYVAAVNQVGGNDELVFDGHAAVYDPRGELIAAGKGFSEDLVVVDVGIEGGHAAMSDPLLTAQQEELLFRALVLGVRDYCRKTGFKSAVLGLSGGIDSAVVAVIAAAAVGRERVLGVSMPSRYSSEGSKSDARELAQRLGIGWQTVPIEGPLTAMLASLREPLADTSGVTEENIQARLRGTILMAFSNKLGHLLLTTGNKSEMAVGYCTLYGDMNGGMAVLSDVSKQWVYRLARWANANPASVGLEPALSGPPIPDASITKPPSAELRPNQTDQDTLPPYAVLDEILQRYIEGRQSAGRIARETGFDAATVSRVVRMIDTSEYKRKQAAIGLKVTSVAFGSGRRMPIAQGWRGDRNLS